MEESIKMAEDRMEKYVDGAANPRIKDSYRTADYSTLSNCL